MAHQQVTIAAQAQPTAEPIHVLGLATPKAMHTQQAAVVAKPVFAREPANGLAAQCCDEPGLAPTLGCLCAPQPGQMCAVAPLQLGDERFPHARQLVNMLVAVHESRPVAQRGLEGIELGADLHAEQTRVQPAHQRLGNDLQQGPRRTPEQWAFGEIQVQADIETFSIQPAQRPRARCEGRRTHHGPDRMYPPKFREPKCGIVDASVQAEVIDHDAQHRAASAMPGSAGSLFWFVLVGSTAAAVHWGVVVLVVERLHGLPLVANVMGWCVAVVVSFAGHHGLTYQGHGVDFWRSARRFLVVSAIGFAFNEVSYALLLHLTGLRYEWLLGAVLVGVALFTYWAGRHWVFLRKVRRP